MWSRLSLLALLSAAGFLSGCAGATYPMPLPPLTPSQLNVAQLEVEAQASEGPPWRHHVTDEEATTVLRAAVERIGPSATQLCHQMAVGLIQTAMDSGMMNTSLSGPERLAVWDEAVREIRATDGRLPPRR